MRPFPLNRLLRRLEAAEVRNYLTPLSIEDNELIGVHVRDIQAAILRIKALIVEADGGTRQRNISDQLQDLAA